MRIGPIKLTSSARIGCGLPQHSSRGLCAIRRRRPELVAGSTSSGLLRLPRGDGSLQHVGSLPIEPPCQFSPEGVEEEQCARS